MKVAGIGTTSQRPWLWMPSCKPGRREGGVGRSSKQKISKGTQVLKDTVDKMDLIDIFRTFHPNAEYTFSSSADGTISRIDHILGHKSNFSKFKKVEIVSSIFSNHNAMRLNISYIIY